MTVNLRNRCSISARATCPGFGWIDAMIFFRALYHSQTSSGFRMKASKFASSSGLNFFQSPSSPRNVGTPLSAEIPAPVKTATESADWSFDIRPEELIREGPSRSLSRADGTQDDNDQSLRFQREMVPGRFLNLLPVHRHAVISAGQPQGRLVAIVFDEWLARLARCNHHIRLKRFRHVNDLSQGRA